MGIKPKMLDRDPDSMNPLGCYSGNNIGQLQNWHLPACFKSLILFRYRMWVSGSPLPRGVSCLCTLALPTGLFSKFHILFRYAGCDWAEVLCHVASAASVLRHCHVTACFKSLILFRYAGCEWAEVLCHVASAASVLRHCHLRVWRKDDSRCCSKYKFCQNNYVSSGIITVRRWYSGLIRFFLSKKVCFPAKFYVLIRRSVLYIEVLLHFLFSAFIKELSLLFPRKYINFLDITSWCRFY